MSEITVEKSSLPPQQELYTDETIQKLSNGLLKLYEQPLKNGKDKIFELTHKQEDLIHRLTAEYNKLYICEFDCEIRIIMATIKMYKDKLLRIKRDMLDLYEKVSDLKERSVRLEQQKVNELRKKTIQIKKEQELIGTKSQTNF